ncbi:MAG: hypothetical protein HY664_07790 [Chloroflexi bacterium]|nr:hypothetical protein [Chloroflexota bacterium]
MAGLLLLGAAIYSFVIVKTPLHHRVTPIENLSPGDLASYPRPEQDNGRGIHWFPASNQAPSVVDLYVSQLESMEIKWVVFLGGTDDFKLKRKGEPQTNSYLVSSLKERGIEPVLRIYMPVGPTSRSYFQRSISYYRDLGVRYFQIFNEPNRPDEWRYPQQLSAKKYIDYWLPLASMVVREGGLPGIGALDPLTSQHPDDKFLEQALAELKGRERNEVLARTWIAIHNYTASTPQQYTTERAGFARFEVYNDVATSVLGYSLAIIGTEGALSSGDHRWQEASDATAKLQAQWVAEGYGFMKKRPPYLLAFSPWLIGNQVGGGQDYRWENSAFFRNDGTPQPVVERIGRPLYIMENGERHWVAPETLNMLGYDLSAAKQMPRLDLEAIPRGQAIPVFGEGSLIKGQTDPVYLVADKQRRWIPDVETFTALDYRWESILRLPDWIVHRVPEGTPLPSATTSFAHLYHPSTPSTQIDDHPRLPGPVQDGDLIIASD